MYEDETPTARGRSNLFGKLIASQPRRERKSAAAATLASMIFHAALIAAAVWATLALGKGSGVSEEEQVMLLRIVEEPPLLPSRPPPPLRPKDTPPPAEVKPPPAEKTTPPPEVEDEPQGFQTLAEPETIPAEIPPSSGVEMDEADFSGEGVEGGRGGGNTVSMEDEPRFTAFDVPPGLKNPAEVLREVRKLYPRMLRRMGITGTVELRILIGADGQVLRTQIRKSSGREAFDKVALSVPEIMRFTPAFKSGEPLAVWLIVPIEFIMQ